MVLKSNGSNHQNFMPCQNKKVLDLKVIQKWIFLIGLTFLFFSCKNEDPIPRTDSLSLYQIFSEDPNFALMREAMAQTDWADTLKGSGRFTVMAPSDKEFQSMGIDQYEDLQPGEWDSLLLYHILPGEYELEQLEGIVPTLLEDYYISVSSEEETKVINGQAGILAADIQASNGWIHALDAVLSPSTYSVLEVSASNDFSIFVEAVQRAGLDELLSGKGPFTIFVPSDEAFQVYFDSNNMSKEDWFGAQGLADFLLYFMVDGEVSAEVINSGGLATRLGTDVHISKIPEEEIWLNGQAKIDLPDLEAGNGIIHGLDQVFTFPEKNLMDKLIEEEDDFTELLGAMSHVGLWEELEDDQDYTVFAPTDAAFAVWYASLEVTGFEEINEDVLRDLLRYHIIPTKVFSQDFGTDSTFPTLQGSNLSLNRELLQANGFGLWQDYYNVHTLNGVIHGIQAVLEHSGE